MMPSKGLDTYNFSQLLKFRRLSSLVQPQSALKNLISVASNFFVYLLFQIKISETYF
jgi:hypothetical protein